MKWNWLARPAVTSRWMIYCPRCQHQVSFQRATSDGAWVCQKCLRYRISAQDKERSQQTHTATRHGYAP